MQTGALKGERRRDIVNELADQGPFTVSFGSGGHTNALHCVTCGFLAISVIAMNAPSNHGRDCLWRRVKEVVR